MNTLRRRRIPKPIPRIFEDDEYKQYTRPHNWRLLSLVGICWVLLIHYFERTRPQNTLSTCQWKNWEQWNSPDSAHRIVLIADPQIVDDYSYPKQFKIINYFTKKLADNYLHRNYEMIHSVLAPDTTIFLGDLFDGGRYWDDKQWIDEYKRFTKIFPKKINRRDIRSVPGNHDIGFQTIRHKVVKRFAEYYGELNDYIELGNHTLVLLDSISLSHPDKLIRKEPDNFLDQLNNRISSTFPRILLTHVPLFRNPATQTCGPHREKRKPFPLQRGDQYQTVIEYEISRRILNTIKPTLIFAGDDHDYCDITQEYDGGAAREITVKSAAMTGGIKHPAVQLLSLNTNEPTKTYETEMCYMPNAYHGLYAYITFLLLTSFFIDRSIVLLNLVWPLFILNVYYMTI